MPPKAVFDVALAARRHASGERLSDLAKEDGMPCAAVIGRHLRASGFPTWSGHRPAPEISEADLRRLHWGEGLAADVIGKRFGVSATTVRRRLRKSGLAKGAGRAPKPRGAANPNWRGGVIRSKGYVFIRRPDHPNAARNGYVAAHRLAGAEKLGRPLLSFEEAHHIDGNKENNDPSNIEVVRRGPHQRLHIDVHRELLAARAELAALKASLGEASA